MHSLKYKRSTALDCKGNGIRKSEFVAKIQFLLENEALEFGCIVRHNYCTVVLVLKWSDRQCMVVELRM